jgi:hypothetical protein
MRSSECDVALIRASTAAAAEAGVNGLNIDGKNLLNKMIIIRLTLT